MVQCTRAIPIKGASGNSAKIAFPLSLQLGIPEGLRVRQETGLNARFISSVVFACNL